MLTSDFHYIDIDGVLVEQPRKYGNDTDQNVFAEAVKKQKKIPKIIKIIKEMDGIRYFCTGRKSSILGNFTFEQLNDIFGDYVFRIQFYPENRGYQPWSVYNIFKLLIIEREYEINRMSIDKIYVWEDSIWVIQAIIKYTTIPLDKLVFKYIHKHEGEYFVNDVNPEAIDSIVEKVEARLKK